jgi:hypothetical protein
MKEQLISSETAKLAKEKGFDIRSEPYRYNPIYEELTVLEGVNAPTQSLLQRWLREVHNINIIITWWIDQPTDKGMLLNAYGFQINGESKGRVFETYELALEAALHEALKLL